MSQIVSFVDSRPPPRFDDVPWTDAEIQEATLVGGPWTTIDTIALDPLDDDPSNPEFRSLSTELASDTPALWYRIIFVDAANGVSQASDAVQNVPPAAGSGDVLSPYALCSIEDVVDLLGYDEDAAQNRRRTIIRSINSASTAIARRGQREFFIPASQRHQTRYTKIESADVHRGYVRVGDLRSAPDAVSVWTPNRDQSFDYTTDDYFLLPDTPEPGFPYEYVNVKNALVSAPLATGWWFCVEADWGFPAVPDNIVQITIATAADFVLNDVMKMTELARQTGRRPSFNALIPPQYEDEVDSFRLYRVA